MRVNPRQVHHGVMNVRIGTEVFPGLHSPASFSNDQAEAFQPFEHDTNHGKWRVVASGRRISPSCARPRLPLRQARPGIQGARCAAAGRFHRRSTAPRLRSTRMSYKNLPSPNASDHQRDSRPSAAISSGRGRCASPTYIGGPGRRYPLVYVTDCPYAEAPMNSCGWLDALQND